MLRADGAVRHCAVIAGVGGVRAVIVPADGAAPLTADEWLARVQAAAAAAPAYARPAEVAVLTAAYASAHALFTADGRPRRRRIAQTLKEVPVRFHDALLAATQAERALKRNVTSVQGVAIRSPPPSSSGRRKASGSPMLCLDLYPSRNRRRCELPSRP